MAGNPSVKKRDGERARAERQREKALQRKERKEQREAIIAAGGDPDIAGIVPGPQPKGGPAAPMPQARR
ncbi:MAG: hypothetical protein ACXWUG_22035 [Polyangiales bacterium]